MKNGKIFKGCMILLALMLCLWTGGLCFAEGEAESGPAEAKHEGTTSLEMQLYEVTPENESGTPIEIQNEANTTFEKKSDDEFRLFLYENITYRLEIKADSMKNLTISKVVPTVSDDILFDGRETDDNSFLFDITDQGTPYYIYIEEWNEENKKTINRIMVQWRGDFKASAEATDETPAENPNEAPSTETPTENLVKVVPIDNPESTEPAEETIPAPAISLSGDKKVKRVSEDAPEWTAPEDFEELLLTVEHITDDKGPVIVTCGDEEAGRETVEEPTEEETNAAAQKKGAKNEKKEVKEKAPIVIDLKEYVRRKIDEKNGEPFDLAFVVNWSVKTEESDQQDNQKTGETSVKIGTVNEDKAEFTLHVIPKAKVTIIPEKTEENQDSSEDKQDGAIRIFADNQNDQLEITVSVNRDYGTVTILQDLGNGEEKPLASAPVQNQPQEEKHSVMEMSIAPEEALAGLVVNENASDGESEQDQGLKNQIQEVVEKSQESGEQAEDTPEEGQNESAEDSEPADEASAEPAPETPEIQEEAGDATQEGQGLPEETTTIQITIEAGSISEDDAKLIVRYENEDGEKAEAEEKIAYTRRWQEISIAAPTEIQYFYAKDSNNPDKTVQFAVDGEAGKDIEVLLTRKDGEKRSKTLTGDNKIYEMTYAETQDTESIQFSYKDHSEQPEKEIKIQTDGEPGEGVFVFKVSSPTIAGPIYDDSQPVVIIEGAVPGSQLVLTVSKDDVSHTLIADENGHAEYTQDEAFAAGAIITISADGDPQDILAETTVLEDTLADIKPEKESYIINAKEAENQLDIRGTAKANREMMATLTYIASESEEEFICSQPFTSGPDHGDATGEWEVVLPEKLAKEGIYKVTFEYTGRNTNQAIAFVQADLHCAFASEDNIDGVISIQEGATELKFYCREPDGFEEIRVVYQPSGDEKPTRIGPTDEKGEFLKTVQPDQNGIITYKLLAPVKKSDQLTVYLKDYTGNDTGDAGIKVEIKTVSFTYALTDGKGEKPNPIQDLYLTEDKEYKIGISGAPGTEVEIAVEKKDGTDRKTLATRKEGEEAYTLSAAALQEAYGADLPASQEFNLILHRSDIESEESDQEFPFIYDTECTLTVNETAKPAAPAFGEKTVSISGSADPDAVVEVTMIRKDGESASKQQRVDENGQFNIETTLKPDSDTIKVTAKDTAGNSAEYEIKVQPSKAVPIILLGAGAILMAISLFAFLSTQKKIKQLEEINRAKTATVQEKKKR